MFSQNFNNETFHWMHLSQSSSHRTTRFSRIHCTFRSIRIKQGPYIAHRLPRLEQQLWSMMHRISSVPIMNLFHALCYLGFTSCFLHLDFICTYFWILLTLTCTLHDTQASFFHDDVPRSCYPFCRKLLCFLCILLFSSTFIVWLGLVLHW